MVGLNAPTSFREASFNISSPYGSVARLYLVRTVFHLGELVHGYFDFANASVTCLRFHLSLQSTESCRRSFDPISAEATASLGLNSANLAFVVVPSASAAAPSGGEAAGNRQEDHHIVPPITNTHEKKEYVCLSHLFMPFSLPIPANVSPEFSARCLFLPGLVVDNQWHLCLTFDLVPDSAGGANQNLTGARQRGQTWILPSDIAVQRLTWSLPIQLLSSDPNKLPHLTGSVFTHPIQF